MLAGKNIVITGCLQGIGRETLKTFAENRANVFACAYRQDEEFEHFCKCLAAENNVQIIPIYFDMMDNVAIKDAASHIHKTKMEINGLVNIAGINKDAYFNMVTVQDMQDTFQVNFFSQIIFSQYIVKIMQRYKTNGSIVFTSSVAALDGSVGQTSYSASKAALIGAMRSMAIELGGNGIRVNTVAPGVIKSPMTDKLSDDLKKERMKKMDIPRLGEAAEVANLYLYLISDLSSHVTGQLIRIDGGMRG